MFFLIIKGVKMRPNKAYAVLIFFFMLTSFFGLVYQNTLFEVEKIRMGEVDQEFHKDESKSLSPYRDQFQPIIVLVFVLLIGLNIYLFLFKFNFILKFYKILLFLASMYCFILLIQIASGYIFPVVDPTRSLPRSLIANILFLGGLVMPIILLRTRHKIAMQNMLGISLCGIMGASVAQYFNYFLLLGALGFISIFDYVNVKKTQKIPKILDLVEKEDIKMTLEIESREKDPSGKKVTIIHQLGYGDLIFSSALVVSLFIDKNILFSLVTMLSMTMSLWLFIYIGTDIYRDDTLPAIPPIFIGGLTGVLISLLLEILI